MFQVSNKFEKTVGYKTASGIKFMKLNNTWNSEQKITTMLSLRGYLCICSECFKQAVFLFALDSTERFMKQAVVC